LTKHTNNLETIHVVGAAIIKDGKCLVAQRAPGMSLAGKWEFPGGKPENGETPEAALARELHEEMGANTDIGKWVGRGESMVGNTRIVLDVYVGQLGNSHELRAHEHSELRWVDAEELASLDWPDADIPIIPLVQELMRRD
jgi:8-oxo-dGTP diphosphatase